MIQDVISMVLALAATVAVIVLAYYASKWYVKRAGTVGGGKHMKVVDRIVVSKTGSIVIVDVQGTQYMVGVSDSSIHMLKQLDAPVPFEPNQETPQTGMGFFKALKTVISEKGSKE